MFTLTRMSLRVSRPRRRQNTAIAVRHHRRSMAH